MANATTGKVWSLDTTLGIVSSNPVNIHSFLVTFTTAGAGQFVAKTYPKEGSAAETIIDISTTAASTAAAFFATQQILMGGQYFSGLQKTTCTNVGTVYVITGIPD